MPTINRSASLLGINTAAADMSFPGTPLAAATANASSGDGTAISVFGPRRPSLNNVRAFPLAASSSATSPGTGFVVSGSPWLSGPPPPSSPAPTGSTTTAAQRRRRTWLLLGGLGALMLLCWILVERSPWGSSDTAAESWMPEELLNPREEQQSTSGGRVSGRREQSSLPRSPLPWRPRYPWRAFFIALNLYNNAAVIPHLTKSLTAFLADEVSPFFDVTERVYLSIFSNGSEDTTAMDIVHILLPALQAIGIPRSRMTVVINGTCCGGLSSRPRAMDRIEWMACVRNAAMQPIYDHGLQLFATPPPPQDGVARTADAANAQEDPVHLASGGGGSPLSSRDVAVIFFNDIIFSRGDMTALLETNYANSMSLKKALQRRSDGGRGLWSPAMATTEREHSSLWDGYDMACGMDFYVSFYDLWVTRGIDGRPFDAYPPYARDHLTQTIFATANAVGSVSTSVHGNHRHVAAPVRCCWNGVAVIRASMFLKHNVRFRRPKSTMFNMSRTQDACYSSECLLICQDIAQVHADRDGGRPQIFINPHVKVAYTKDDYDLHKQHWFVSSAWYFRVVSLIRWTSWLLPDTFQPVLRRVSFGDGDDGLGQYELDWHWMECVLPMDTLPGSGWLSGMSVCVLVAVVAVGLWWLRRMRSSRRRSCPTAADASKCVSGANHCGGPLWWRQLCHWCSKHILRPVVSAGHSNSGSSNAATPTTAVVLLSSSNTNTLGNYCGSDGSQPTASSASHLASFPRLASTSSMMVHQSGGSGGGGTTASASSPAAVLVLQSSSAAKLTQRSRDTSAYAAYI